MKKVALIMVIILVAIVAISFLLKACDTTAKAPTVIKTLDVIHADTRYYYTDDYEITDTYYYLNGWWDTNGTAWKYHSYRLPLLISAYNSITVEKR